jgi:hypothetical protein
MASPIITPNVNAVAAMIMALTSGAPRPSFVSVNPQSASSTSCNRRVVFGDNSECSNTGNLCPHPISVQVCFASLQLLSKENDRPTLFSLRRTVARCIQIFSRQGLLDYSTIQFCLTVRFANK